MIQNNEDKAVCECPNESEEPVENGVEPVKTAAKKKKKKKHGKKLVELGAPVNNIPCQDNEKYRLLGTWPEIVESRQTPSLDAPVDRCYAKGEFPIGEISFYDGNNGVRASTEEAKEKDRLSAADYDDLRRAAEAHRQTRRFIQGYIKPGQKVLDIVQALEAKSKQLINANGLEAGWAFPTGFSIDHCAAHYTPNYGEPDVVLNADNLVKVDFGVHVRGRLIDCAFSVAFNEKFDPLIKATQDATNTGLRLAGIDARFSEIGAAIEETIDSYEIDLDGKTYRVKPIRNLNGHTTDVYQVHGGKSLPIVATDTTERMEEGEVYAIETFASTGKGYVWESGDCSHYMMDYDWSQADMTTQNRMIPRIPSARTVLNSIKQHFSTLAFCRRWLDDAGCTRHILGLKSLQNAGIVNPYPPLCDIPGCYTSQMEHTILLRPTCKEVLSRGLDF